MCPLIRAKVKIILERKIEADIVRITVFVTVEHIEKKTKTSYNLTNYLFCCIAKEACSLSYMDTLYRTGRDFFDIQYLM